MIDLGTSLVIAKTNFDMIHIVVFSAWKVSIIDTFSPKRQ
jgi:hypothetical protein